MRVSLYQRHRPERLEPHDAPTPLLEPAGARVVLGGFAPGGNLAEPVRAAADSLFGPRGAVIAEPSGPLFVSDTGHHRVLGWRGVPRTDRAPADFVLGQRDFTGEGRNANGPIGPATLNVPTGIAAGPNLLAVADAWNHRVLLWHRIPATSACPADIVLGQANFTSNFANRGSPRPAADTLNWCYGVAICGGRLIVADTGNRRVLIWNKVPQANGTPADFVLGQRDFTRRDEGGGEAVEPHGMRWPHGVAMASGRLFVADAGTSRIMIWHSLPETNGTPCEAVLGQATFDGRDHNRGAYDPDAAALNMPYGIAAMPHCLAVADTASSRLVGFDLEDVTTGMQADRLTGQRSFHDKGENRWERLDRAGVCWPYGLSVCGSTAVVADSGNNRVLLWEMA